MSCTCVKFENYTQGLQICESIQTEGSGYWLTQKVVKIPP